MGLLKPLMQASFFAGRFPMECSKKNNTLVALPKKTISPPKDPTVQKGCNTHMSWYSVPGSREVKNTQLCSSNENFHTVVLKDIRNISGTLDNPPMKFLVQHCIVYFSPPDPAGPNPRRRGSAAPPGRRGPCPGTRPTRRTCFRRRRGSYYLAPRTRNLRPMFERCQKYF